MRAALLQCAADPLRSFATDRSPARRLGAQALTANAKAYRMALARLHVCKVNV